MAIRAPDGADNNQIRNDINIRTLKFDSLAFASRW